MSSILEQKVDRILEELIGVKAYVRGQKEDIRGRKPDVRDLKQGLDNLTDICLRHDAHLASSIQELQKR